MGDNTKGLYDKFRVERADGANEPGRKHHGCQYFPLDLTHDRHAVPAILAYARSCEAENPTLAGELRQKVQEVTKSDVVHLASYGAQVHQWMNHRLFARLLEATQAEALACGFQFIKGDSSVELDETVKLRIGTAVLRTKFKHVSPFQSEDSINQQLDNLVVDGDPLAWADDMIAALKAHGITVAHSPSHHA